MGSRAEISFRTNSWDIYRLIDIHVDVGGTGSGRRYGVEVLNKSAVVLTTACWEAYVEDICGEALTFILRCCVKPSDFPRGARLAASEPLRSDPNGEKVWQLAGSGWKKVLEEHGRSAAGQLNTPSARGVDELLEEVIGLRRVSASWSWSGMSADRARRKLARLLKMRGSIVHRSTHPAPVRRRAVEDFLDFVEALVASTERAVYNYVRSRTGREPWPAL